MGIMFYPILAMELIFSEGGWYKIGIDLIYNTNITTTNVKNCVI